MNQIYSYRILSDTIPTAKEISLPKMTLSRLFHQFYPSGDYLYKEVL